MDTNSTNRKAVEDLTVGEHVSDNTGVHEVAHNLSYRNGDGNPMRALTFNPLGAGDPWVGRYAQGVKLHLATDDEVREFHDTGRRLALVSALHQLADEILSSRLPVPTYSLSVHGGVHTRADLERWAAHLGVDVRMGGTDADIPVVDTTRKVGQSLTLGVYFQSPAEPKPVVKPLEVDAAIAAAKALEPEDTGRVAECGCHIFLDPLEDAEEVIHDTACQNWYFTFGSTHVHPDSPAINPEGGRPLDDRFVVIRGTYEIARALMERFFGRKWCDQYESIDRAGVERFGLTELRRRHWPKPAEFPGCRTGLCTISWHNHPAPAASDEQSGR
ncbi:hypothetical protein ACWER9_06735 [Micromonospora sp. NPDC003944]